jgi:hypothetical protein
LQQAELSDGAVSTLLLLRACPQCASLQQVKPVLLLLLLLLCCRRSLPVIAYESQELQMAAAVDKELNLPQHVRDFNIEAFLKSLGYTTQNAGYDNIMWPPGKQPAAAKGRRRLLAMPPHRR